MLLVMSAVLARNAALMLAILLSRGVSGFLRGELSARLTGGLLGRGWREGFSGRRGHYRRKAQICQKQGQQKDFQRW